MVIINAKVFWLPSSTETSPTRGLRRNAGGASGRHLSVNQKKNPTISVRKCSQEE